MDFIQFCSESEGKNNSIKILSVKKLKTVRSPDDLEAVTDERSQKSRHKNHKTHKFLVTKGVFIQKILLTDSNFILTEKTRAIAITAAMSYKTAVAADFK